MSSSYFLRKFLRYLSISIEGSTTISSFFFTPIGVLSSESTSDPVLRRLAFIDKFFFKTPLKTELFVGVPAAAAAAAKFEGIGIVSDFSYIRRRGVSGLLPGRDFFSNALAFPKGDIFAELSMTPVTILILAYYPGVFAYSEIPLVASVKEVGFNFS